METAIKSNKPSISASSLKTYMSVLKSLYFKKHDKKASPDINIHWFDNQDEIIELLADKPASSRKTTYAALIAITDKNDKYKAALMDDGKAYDKFIKSQTKTEKQEEAWKSFDEVKHIVEAAHSKVKPLLNSKTPLSLEEYKKVQDFIILALTSGVYISPRRSMDWVDMKLKDVNRETDNYIDRGNFVFNKYKTAKYYQQQKVSIPKDLKLILNKFIKLNPHEYLLTTDKGTKMTGVRLNQKLNKLFDGAISTSMLRHIYLTEELKNVPALEKLEQMAHDMAHSVGEALEYVKK